MVNQTKRTGIKMSWRGDRTIPENAFTEAGAYYASVRSGMREKANHNKHEAQWCFATIITSTLLAPLFVTLGTSPIFAKIIPSCLSVLAAGLTSWLQLRKPQRLWTLYRRAQRDLEQIKANYDFDDGEFECAEDKNKLLARNVTTIAYRVHQEWEGLVPEPYMITSSTKTNSSEKTDDQASPSNRKISS
jgi:hypothetical protein